jgi:hypothetical protein
MPDNMIEQVTAVLRERGWTCEYHEPVTGPGECSQCDDAHRKTAASIIGALQLQESRLTLFTGTLVSWSTPPVFEPATKL